MTFANFRPHATTMQEAIGALIQREQVNPITQPDDDGVEWLEKGDAVRIERLVRRNDAPPEFGTLVEVNTQAQWGLVQFHNSTRREWFPVCELYLDHKAGALAPAYAETNAR